MRIIDLDHLDNKSWTEKTSIALGNFDGLHEGHQCLIERVVSYGAENHLTSSVLLFKSHSRDLLSNHATKILTNLDQKLQLLDQMGVELVFLKEFDNEFMSMTPEEFISNLLLKTCQAECVVVGYDYRFGNKAMGDVAMLSQWSLKLGYHLFVESPIKDESNFISSSRIRQLILKGKVEEAAELLTRPHTVEGVVVKGVQRGRTLGFPTANICLSDNYVIPENGVFYTKINVRGRQFSSLTDIGTNPTFENSDKIKIETHILDFQGDIYGEQVSVSFVRFIRPDVIFSGAEELICQIEQDILWVKNLE